MSDINTTPLVDVMLVLLIIFLIAVPVAIQTVEQLEIPIFESIESKDKVENLQLTVTTTDAEGRTAGVIRSGFTGATRTGECRVYFNNIKLEDADAPAPVPGAPAEPADPAAVAPAPAAPAAAAPAAD